ncbi:MAG: sigma factor [Nitrospira sp.]
MAEQAARLIWGWGGLLKPMAAEGGEAGDETLAERVRAGGDTAAFAILVTRYRGRVVALARRMLAERGGGPDEAEDVAQETFVAAYDRPGRPSGAANRSARQAVPHRGQPLPGSPARPGAPPWPSPTSTAFSEPAEPDASSARGDPGRRARWSAAKRRRRPAAQTARRVSAAAPGRPVLRGIASAMGLPLGTVKTHLFRARAHLRQALSGYWQS